MCRRLGFALLVGVLAAALVLPPAASAQDESSSGWNPFSFLRSSFSSLRSTAARSFDAVKNTTLSVAHKVVRFAVVRSTEDEICYRIIGCFNLKAPWFTLSRPLPAPKSPDSINVEFFLYTRESASRFTIPSDVELSLQGSTFDGAKRTFFLVHGFLNSGNDEWMAKLKDAILGQVDGNVFIVNWGGGAIDPNYLQAASNTRVVGREIARLGRTLIQQHGAAAKDMHIIGHSLGAHISGYAARNITNVGRVTGMDPAGPGFEALSRTVRLNKNCATFVDALHTNARPLTQLGFGIMQTVAHVDFYLNGGEFQPGCATPSVEMPSSLTDLISLPVTALNELVSCSHTRSYHVFTEAIANTTCRFWGHKTSVARQRLKWRKSVAAEVPVKEGPCRSGKCVPIGLDTPDFPARGSFAVVTGSDSPYCLQERSKDGQSLEQLRILGYVD
ncbi:pancreatic triacylglycerol lipase-like [Thrips palmi]|uniref:Pancreatic triacylglycerol lipase-like n=1 Tax=Thrips palmi TaxID=161013 RepID=A0A6P8ZPQ1_THRPL|nr:pancreatic triacylglycerol lipase-like [Thrips palmi]